MSIPRSVFAASFALVVLAGAATARHLHMTDSLPKGDETVTESPEEVRVWFNQHVSLAVSRMSLEGPDGDVDVGKAVETEDPKSFKAPVEAELVAGLYTVTWRTAGDDGHVQRGEFSFTVAAAEKD